MLELAMERAVEKGWTSQEVINYTHKIAFRPQFYSVNEPADSILFKFGGPIGWADWLRENHVAT